MKRFLAFMVMLCLPLTAAAQQFRLPIAEQNIGESDFFLIDAQCSAVFRLMGDIGTQRGSELAEVYLGAAGFMAGNAVSQHQEIFGTQPEQAKAVVQARIVQDHSKYIAGIQATEASTQAAEVTRFSQDVIFCNARLGAYEKAINEAKQ